MCTYTHIHTDKAHISSYSDAIILLRAKKGRTRSSDCNTAFYMVIRKSH